MQVSLNALYGLPVPKQRSNKVDIEGLLYLLKFGSRSKNTGSRRLPEELVNDVREFLIKEHSETLREAFGNPEKKAMLRKLITHHISHDMNKTQKGFSLEELSAELVNEIAGLSIFDRILSEDEGSLTDIKFNGKDIWVVDNKRGKYLSPYKISSEEVEAIVKKISYATSKQLNFSKPEMDTELPYLRVNAVTGDIAPYGVTFSIRRQREKLQISDDSFKEVMANEEVLEFLAACMKSRLNVLITGETGVGKTELFKFLVGKTGDLDSINLMEDTLETNLPQLYPHKDIFSWRTRSAEREEDQIGFDRLLRSSLRSNPDWIMITETRGREAFSMVKAILTGHSMMTSAHSPSATEGIDRVILMCQEAVDLKPEVLGKMVAKAFDIGIHIELDQSDMTRKIVEIVEYVDYKDHQTIVKPLIGYETVNTEERINDNGESYFYSEKEHRRMGAISEELAEKLLQKQALNRKLLPLLPESWAIKKRISKSSAKAGA